MPLRDYREYVSDVVEACNRIMEYSQGLTLEDYEREGMKRDAIERRLVIGEALAQARQHYPQVSNDIQDKLCEKNYRLAQSPDSCLFTYIRQHRLEYYSRIHSHFTRRSNRSSTKMEE